MSSLSPRLVLALNAGSSSLKASVLNASVLDSPNHEEGRWVTCLAERLGTDQAHVHVTIHPHFPTTTTDTTTKTHEFAEANYTQADALKYLMQVLEKEDVMQHVVAVGHRVVHGGTDFTESLIVPNENVLAHLDAVSHLAPLYVS